MLILYQLLGNLTQSSVSTCSGYRQQTCLRMRTTNATTPSALFAPFFPLNIPCFTARSTCCKASATCTQHHIQTTPHFEEAWAPWAFGLQLNCSGAAPNCCEQNAAQLRQILTPPLTRLSSVHQHWATHPHLDLCLEMLYVLGILPALASQHLFQFRISRIRSGAFHE